MIGDLEKLLYTNMASTAYIKYPKPRSNSKDRWSLYGDDPITVFLRG